MADVETSASCGCICFKNTSLESQAGCFDSCHAEHASAPRLREAACLARASGLRAARRPIRAASTRRSVAPSMAQFAESVRSGLMPFPQPLQTCSGFGCFTVGTSLSFASRLFRCVRRVAMSRRASLDGDAGLDTEDHTACATYSATGATSLRQVSVVPQSFTANDEARRQLPLRSSQKSERRRASR
jgi:hypothetical protein